MQVMQGCSSSQRVGKQKVLRSRLPLALDGEGADDVK